VKLLPVTLLLLIPSLGFAASAGWAPNITTTVTWNSNATNADRSAEVIGALALRAEVASAVRFALGPDDALFAGGSLRATAWPRFDGLDQAAIGPRLTWQHKFGLGALAPVLSVEFAADAVATRESARRAHAGSVTFALRKRLDEATRVALTHERAREDAREFVFDRTGAETSLELTRDLDERWSLAFTARWREGDVLSYATPPRPDLVAVAHTRVPNTTFDRALVAYSLDARSLTGGLSATRALDESTALTFRYEWRETERGPLRYVNHLVSAALTRQF
jgi:hypothetical protein